MCINYGINNGVEEMYGVTVQLVQCVQYKRGGTVRCDELLCYIMLYDAERSD